MKIIRKIIIFYWIELIVLDFLDFKRYMFNAFKLRIIKSKNNLLGMITLNYHSLEKGLTNTKIRYGFGKKALSNIFFALDKYIAKFPNDLQDSRFQSGIAVLNRYYIVNKDFVNLAGLKSKLEIYEKYIKTNYEGGEITKSKVDKSNYSFEALAISRSSVRDYANNDDFDYGIVKKAFNLASKTPSVCNRQAWYSYLVTDLAKISEILSIQRGLTNMGNNIKALVVVTGDNSFFAGARERNQVFIDTGMYAMSLIYSFESLNIASCALNANLGYIQEKKIRKLLNIRKSNSISMFITIGSFTEIYKVPVSNRVPFEENVEVIN